MNKLKKNKKWRVASGQKLKNNLSLITQHSSLNTGLTLIEIMVVVAILAIISSTLFSVFQGSLLSQRRGTNKALVYSEARAALDMMSREIEKAMVSDVIGGYVIYCVGVDELNPNKIQGGGNYRSSADEFFFIAPLNPGNTGTPYKGELCEVGYWLKTDANGEDSTLMRHYITDHIDFDFETPTNWTASSDPLAKIYDLDFKYRGISGTYIPDWPQSNTSLPRAIKITLVMQEEEMRDTSIFHTFTTVVDIPGSGQ